MVVVLERAWFKMDGTRFIREFSPLTVTSFGEAIKKLQIELAEASISQGFTSALRFKVIVLLDATVKFKGELVK
jgi:hypothetical protein